jgi:hypothetical protein
VGEKPTEADEAGIAVSDPGSPADKRTVGAGQVTEIVRREAGGGGEGVAIDEEGVQRAVGQGSPPAAEGTINTSKSNTFREAGGGGEGIAIDEEGVQRTNLNSSKSNLQRAAGDQEPPEPAEGTNLNSSKSN